MPGIEAINGADRTAFLAMLGGVFEHSPWVAERAFRRKPFASLDALHDAMLEAMRSATREEQLSLVLANALFAAIHSHISPWTVLMVFVPGLVWGVLYARHRSLLGVAVSHAIVGIWTMRVLGFGELFELL